MNIFKPIIKKIFSNKQKIDYSNLIVEMDERSKQYIDISSKYTFKSILEMWTVISSLRNIINQKIEGDIVETGVWKGGTIILIKKILSENNIKKKVFGFDTFEGGFDKPKLIDKKVKYGETNLKNIYTKDFKYKNFETSSLKDTLINIQNNCENIDDLILIKGKVENTLIKQDIKKVSFLLLDTDYYDSTLFSLNSMYDKVVKNGIIYIDDYGNWKGAKQAVDEFFIKKNIKPLLIRTSFASRILIKNF